MVLVIAVIAVFEAMGLGFDIHKVLAGYDTMFGSNLVVILLGSRAWMLWRRWRGVQSWRNPVSLDNDLALFRVTAFLFAYITLYSNIKARIPALNFKVHDRALRAFEVGLLGFDPVEWVGGLKVYPSLVEFFDGVYHHGYIPMTLCALILYVNHGNRHLRHLFVSMGLLYLAGVLVTALWPTLGPCFSNRDAYLWMQAGKVESWDNQAWLLRSYAKVQAGVVDGTPIEAGAFMGIAALPSLHVGHCMLLCLFSWHYLRPALYLMVPVTLATWIATLLFGWHFLADGVASIPLVFGAFWLSQRIVFGRDPVGLRDAS